MRSVAQVVGLECRQLLTAWASLPDGVWSISGTDRGDTVVVETDVDNPSRAALFVNGRLTQRARLRDIDSIRINAGGGNDRVTVNLSERATNVSVLIDGGWGNDTLTGGRTSDELRGGLGNDALSGRDGNDRLFGDHGVDRVYGGDGDDQILGGLGNDKMDGGLGKDSIDGGRNDDVLLGAGGRDTLAGAAGIDVLDGGSGRDVLGGGSGMDRIVRQLGRDSVKDSTSRQSDGSDVARLEQVSGGDLISQLVERAIARNVSSFGQPTSGGLGQFELSVGAAFTNVFGSADATNRQEAGVDEADILETDGTYLYSLDSDELHIVDASNPAAMAKSSTTALEGNGVGLYLLDGNRLVVITSISPDEPAVTNTPGSITFNDLARPRRSITRVTTFDVSDRNAPAELGHTDFDGMYVDSRVVGSNVYVVTGENLALNPQTVGEGASQRWETEAEFRARVEASASEWMPSYTATRNGQSTTGELLSPGNVYLPENSNTSDQFATVSLVDGRNAGNGVIDSASVGGNWVSTVYGTDNAIYLAGASWDSATASTMTSIAKIGITESTVSMDATGEIEGTLLNQYSLDEYDGKLRVAVTQGAKGSAILVLESFGDTLDIVGDVTGLAPGEQIFSASFDGDVGYLVTYEQVDPLFVVDLSDPTNPRKTGELKIPGVSRYLQPINDRYVLGIGNDGDENGRLTDTQVSLFDVSDMTAPKRVSSYTFDTPETGGAIMWQLGRFGQNAHSIQYFAEDDLLAIPIGTGDDAFTQLLKVDLDTGTLNEAGKIENGDVSSGRTVKIGQTLYAVDTDSISTYSLATETPANDYVYNAGGTAVSTAGGWGWWGGTVRIFADVNGVATIAVRR
jgi:uncharacterized secreted protein with C-terminal beta-propeller domain